MAKQYGLVFDLRRCTGCLTCVIACKDENNLDAGYSWMKVVTEITGKYPRPMMYWRPITCMHCQNPPCLGACPQQAIYRRQDGIVLIEEASVMVVWLAKLLVPTRSFNLTSTSELQKSARYVPTGLTKVWRHSAFINVP